MSSTNSVRGFESGCYIQRWSPDNDKMVFVGMNEGVCFRFC